MKPLLCMTLFAVLYIQADAQKSSTQKSALLNELNRKAKECNGNLRFFKKSDPKAIIDNASFTATEFGVKYNFELKRSGYSDIAYTYEFRPEDIEFLYDQNLPAESPVGQVKISLSKTLGSRTDNSAKKSEYVENIIDYAYINFLQVDRKNFASVQQTLFDLKKAYQEDKDERLKPLTQGMKKYRDFWVSAKGESKTYKLYDVVESGCSVRFTYSLQAISTSGDTKGSFISIVNLDDISDAWYDDTKTKPGCIILKSGKKGFETFVKKGTEYKQTDPIKELPLFINIEFGFEKQDVLDILNEQIRQCGGKKIKL